MANLFYETKLFEFSEPNFIVIDAFTSNDSYFSSQWGLKNTGQNGGVANVDIKIESVWTITQGNPDIKIAVVDTGTDLTHPDLSSNLLSGFDASGNNLGGAPVWDTDKHGTACSGIIGAIKDNGIGVSGVAPSCKMIPIHTSSSSGGLPNDWAANSIQWAWQNGADIISNSWGGGSPNAQITNAISNATTQGRNGKGCVVAFSSGNNNSSSVNYPGYLSNVIAVGAIDRCGVRSGRIDIIPNSCDPWCSSCQPGSAYGEALDVVAPGTNVYTTDRQGTAGYNTASGINGNYYSGFGGTSAACPHIAGVAALILSANPNLTEQEVRNIIESTAQKVRPDLYTYSTIAGHPNGTWNNEMGYGLVDAYAAVQAACQTVNFTDQIVNSNQTVSGCDIYVQNVIVQSGAKLTLDATHTTTIDDNFEVAEGAELEIK